MSVWAAPVAAAQPVPKVALVVGPVGSITPAYRALANEAADAARAAGAEVVKVYSPNATWPAVRQALDGASIVVYLGHGNGWPSRYRDALYPPTQNGFGLNPVGGAGDDRHQYFGEASIEKLRLAPNAVVVFSHLCYASGNTEPGLPEGSVGDAIQRVDNYASGFLRAGAKAVVAEAGLGPAYYVRSLLRDRGSIEQIWRSSPTVNGDHQIVTPASGRPGTPSGSTPSAPASGFRRSLVSPRRDRVASCAPGAQGRAGAARRAGHRRPRSRRSPAPGSGSASRRSGPCRSPAATTRLTLPLARAKTSGVPERRPGRRSGGTRSSSTRPPRPTRRPSSRPCRCDPRDQDGPTPARRTPARQRAGPGADGHADARARAGPGPVAPEVDLVVPEAIGSVVEPDGRPADEARPRRSTSPTRRSPACTGSTVTLHTPEGVAYDAATQALLAPVLVRVGGALAVAYGAPQTLALATGSTSEVAVRVLNAGSHELGQGGPGAAGPHRDGRPGRHGADAHPAAVAGRHLDLDGRPRRSRPPSPSGSSMAVAEPGGSAVAVLPLEAPSVPGNYLLLLDVVDARTRARCPHGAAVRRSIRVTVGDPVAPAAAPVAPAAEPAPAAAPAAIPSDAPVVSTLPLAGDD